MRLGKNFVMTNRLLKLSILLVTIILYNTLFWQQQAGINLFLFNLILISLSIFQSRESLNNRETLTAITLMIISGSMVVLYNSGWSIFMHIVFTILSLGLLKQSELRHVFDGFIGFFASYFTSPMIWIRKARGYSKKDSRFSRFYSFLKLGIIPLVLFGLFFIIYRNASPKFEELTQTLWNYLSQLLGHISFGKAFFLLFGASLISFALFKSQIVLFPFTSSEEKLSRKKRIIQTQVFPSKENLLSELLNEYKIGVLVFAVLNLLLLAVNILDINWIWIDFEVPAEFNLKQFVHEGTFLLIFSILLSIAIFLYFFRGSLNFYPKNKWLLILGISWIAQNMILAISVFLRNYHYIDYHGLAGGRIGVITFIVFTFFGLLTLILKVKKLKTFAYLIRLNSWFILVTLGLMCCLNWDRHIVHYNLSHQNPEEIDVDYYLKLSPSVYPIILQNLPIIEKQMEAHMAREGKDIWVSYLDIDLFKDQIEYQTSEHLKSRRDLAWPSWNFADHKLSKRIDLIEE